MQALRAQNFFAKDVEGQETLISATHDYAIDIVGIIYNEDWELNPDTLEISKPPSAVNGWHLNYLGKIPSGWEQYLVYPNTPRRVFFGVE